MPSPDSQQHRSSVLLSGATGFVGRYVAEALVAAGYAVRALVRSSRSSLPSSKHIEPIVGDVTDPESLSGVATGCVAAVHLVGIIEESRRHGTTFERVHVKGTRHIVDAAMAGGVPVFVHMSANGAAPNGATRYQTTKFEAEEIVRNAGFDRWTIFRPSIIFGKPASGCPEFASQLVETLIRPFPVWPIFGDGQYRLQPIAVADVARAFAQAVSDDSTRGKTYCVGGQDTFTYLEILDLLAAGAGLKSKPRLHQPLWLVRPVVELLAPTGLLPITPEQLEMLVGGNTCDASDFLADFNIQPVRLTTESLAYLRRTE